MTDLQSGECVMRDVPTVVTVRSSAINRWAEAGAAVPSMWVTRQHRAPREDRVARVRFPDGTTVEAVGIQERRADKPDRDYGLYLDARWRPTWNADVIEWEDFGLPANFEATADVICKAFGRAKQRQRVEIGCFGGVGRT